jgi:fructose-specific component phosphotransferase system IIB-like protein
MKAERVRLVRLKRLEKLRAIARQNALAEAGRAEARLAQLENLGARTAALITGYAARTDAACGGDLVSQRVYLGELQHMVARNDADIARARDQADARAAQAAAAERSRAAVEDRANATETRIARQQTGAAVPLGARPPPRS